MMSNAGLCPHVAANAWPFQVELVLDDHLGPTESLVRCRHCRRVYRLELLDWCDSARVMRVAALEAAHAEALVRDLTRGSCDVTRAGAEVQHLRQLAPFLPVLLLVDTTGPAIDGVAEVPAEVTIPADPWRDLPLRGEWVDYVRSKIEIVNG